MKKLLLFSVLGFVFLDGANAANITVYYSPACPHCRHLREFIENHLIYEYPKLVVSEINVTKKEALSMFQGTLDKCKYTSGGVPLFVIGDKCFQGYADFMAPQLREAVEIDLSEQDRSIAANNKKELEKNPEQFKAKNASRLSAISEYEPQIAAVEVKKKVK